MINASNALPQVTM